MRPIHCGMCPMFDSNIARCEQAQRLVCWIDRCPCIDIKDYLGGKSNVKQGDFAGKTDQRSGTEIHNDKCSGPSVLSAVQRSYAPKGAERKADFFDLVAWRSTAEFICKYFTKGQEIIISGELRQEDWTDRNGNKRTSINVVVEDVNFCGSKPDGQRSSHPETQYDYTGEYSEIEDDGEVPFL